MRRLDRNIDHLEEQAPVSDYASHAHQLVPIQDGDAIERVRQADRGGLFGFGTQARGNPEAAVLVWCWSSHF
jgi:hypothetical protein